MLWSCLITKPWPINITPLLLFSKRRADQWLEKSGNLMWYQTSCLESNISHQKKKRYCNLGLGKKCPTIACLLILALIYPIIYEVPPWLSWAASSSSYLEGTANSFVWHHLFSQQQNRDVGRSGNSGGSGGRISSNQLSFSGSL